MCYCSVVCITDRIIIHPYIKVMKDKGQVSGAVYGLGFLGAAVYFIQHAHSFWIGTLGILKAIIWPALLVYHSLSFLKL